MLRASTLALMLVALPASALDLEKWMDKQADKFLEEGRKEQLRALSSKNPDERLEAVRFFSGRKDPDSVNGLAKALSDKDARVREAAASGLWEIEEDAEPARPQLTAALDDPDPNVVAQAAGALQSMGMKESELVAVRKRVLDSPAASPTSRFLVSRNLIGQEPSIKLLYPMLTYLEITSDGYQGTVTNPNRDNFELGRKGLERLVKKTQDRDLIEPLVTEMKKGRREQATLLQTLGLFEPKPPRWAETLVSVLPSNQPNVRYEALGQMRDLKQEKDVRVWAPAAGAMLQDPDDSVRSNALWALGSAGGLSASETDKVVAALGDKSKSVRRSAASALGEMGESNQAVPAANKARVATAARPALTAALNDSDEDVRREAKSALAKLVPAGAASVASAAPGPAVPSYSGAARGSEASGMAVLRARDVKFEEGMYARALYEVDVELVRAFLDAGMSPKDPLAGMGSPIRVLLFGSVACSARERPTKPAAKEILRMLIERGTDVNLTDQYGNSPLSEAASKGCDREFMRTLIKAGAKVNTVNVSGFTPFEMGLYNGGDGLEEIIAAGYRLPPAKAKDYSQTYKDKPAVMALIRKASAK